MKRYIVTFRTKRGDEFTTHVQNHFTSKLRAIMETYRALREFEREYNPEFTRIKMYDVTNSKQWHTDESIPTDVKAELSFRIYKGGYYGKSIHN